MIRDFGYDVLKRKKNDGRKIDGTARVGRSLDMSPAFVRPLHDYASNNTKEAPPGDWLDSRTCFDISQD